MNTAQFPDTGCLPSNEMVIRRANMSGMSFIYGFVCQLKEENFEEVIFAQLYTACLAQDDHYYLVAAIAGAPFGYLSCDGQVLLHQLGMVYEIQEMFVDGDYRRMGLGKVVNGAGRTF